LTAEADSAIAANRFGLGARPGDLASIGTDARGWLQAQLRGGPPLLDTAELPSTAQIAAGAEPILAERRAARRTSADSSSNDDADAVQALAMRLPQYLRPIYQSDGRARWRAAMDSDRSFIERLVHFWSNHFAVSVDKFAVLGIAGSFEREAIRPHVSGRFFDLLLAVETHPAMLLYLDNQQSAGANSPLAQRAARGGRTLGLNENLGREIMELHTLGVDGGYTQTDVTNFAKVLTGWSIGGGQGRLASGAPGTFLFRANLHEPGAQTIRARRYAEADQAQGIAVLNDLAAAPATARHIASKLCRHFIADEPPRDAVEELTQAYLHSGGDLVAVYSALIESRFAWQASLPKFKTPQDYLFSIGRGLQLPPQIDKLVMNAFNLLGQRPFAPGSPAGWPDRNSDWDGSAELMKRIELSNDMAQKLGDRRDALVLAPQLLGGTLTIETRQAIARAASPAQALALLMTAPEFLRR
jgi:uncharacterized protein (DUF1800 family)